MTTTDRGTHQTAAGGAITLSKASTSFTPAAGAQLVVIEWLNAVSGPGGSETFNLPTDTFGDTGGTAWAAVTNAYSTRGAIGAALYNEGVKAFSRTIGTGPGAGAITCTASVGGGSTTPTDGWYGFHIWEKSDPDVSPVAAGANAIGSSSSTITTDLGAAHPASTSAVFGMAHADNEIVTATQPSGFTSDDNQSPAWGASTQSVHIDSGASQTQQWSGYTNSASDRHLAVTVEITTASAGLAVPILDPPRWDYPSSILRR